MTQMPPNQQPQPAATAAAHPRPGKGLSVAAIILGALGIIPVLGWLTALIGLILGIIAVVKKAPMAIAALIVPIAGGLAGILVASMILIPALSAARGKARETVAAVRVQATVRAINMFESETNRYPRSLDELIENGTLKERDIHLEDEEDPATRFIYIPPQGTPDSDTILVVTPPTDWFDARVVGFADGTVKSLTAEEFESLAGDSTGDRLRGALDRTGR